jgi:hypothetical protein
MNSTGVVGLGVGEGRGVMVGLGVLVGFTVGGGVAVGADVAGGHPVPHPMSTSVRSRIPQTTRGLWGLASR